MNSRRSFFARALSVACAVFGIAEETSVATGSPSMRIPGNEQNGNKALLKVPPVFWYENKSGDRWIPGNIFWRDGGGVPVGFEYQWSASPTILHESCCSVSGPQIMTSETTWPDDLVLAMANHGYRLRDAIIVAAKSCERCTNVLAFEHGLNWGYADDSAESKRCNTSCDQCAPHHAAPDADGIMRNLRLEQGL